VNIWRISFKSEDRSRERVTGGRWRRIVLGDVLAERRRRAGSACGTGAMIELAQSEADDGCYLKKQVTRNK